MSINERRGKKKAPAESARPQPSVVGPVLYRTESARLSTLVGAEYNPRMMPDHERVKLKRSIVEFGLVEPIVVRADGMIIGGHQRVVALRELLAEQGVNVEDFEVPVVRLDLDDTKAKLLNLALNRISGEWDATKLVAIFEELGSVDWSDDLHGLSGFDLRELETLREYVSVDTSVDDRSEKSSVGAVKPESVSILLCPHCGGDVPYGGGR